MLVRKMLPTVIFGTDLKLNDAERMQIFMLHNYSYRITFRCNQLQLLLAVMGSHMAMAAVGGSVGYETMKHTGSYASGINAAKFTFAMFTGAAILGLLTSFGMFLASGLVEERKIHQNTATFKIGIPWYAAMGAAYALTGAGMQHLLVTSGHVAFVAFTGAISNAAAYSMLLGLREAKECVFGMKYNRTTELSSRLITEEDENVEPKNCCLRMYQRYKFGANANLVTVTTAAVQSEPLNPNRSAVARLDV
jgi:hypothetical protein